MSKLITLTFTEKQLATLTQVIYEYGNICDSEADVSYASEGTKYKQDKSLAVYKFARACDRLLDRISKQTIKNYDGVEK